MIAGRDGLVISHLFFADDLLLFSGALEEDVDIIMETLEEFKKASNFKKGPIQEYHKRVAEKLKGWKAKCLSLADRITLAKAVITLVVNFDMMNTQIPKNICNEIENCKRGLFGRKLMDKKYIL
ncbi:hypothetical protein AHAS_Ahas01G0061200 [Arachis hypogaea]